MKRLLPLLPRPTRYLGSEWGTVHKDINKVRAHIALCFPDLYEVGMSYLGQKILYEIVNRHPDFYAERGYVPCKDTADIIREHGELLSTMESDTPLKDVDIVGVSMTHELCYTNVLYMLDLAGIPLRTKDRGEDCPLIIAGGGSVFSAEPMADFLDAMMLGDGEESIIRVLETVAQCKENGAGRHETLEALSKLPGLYIPSFFDPENPGDTCIEKAIVDDLEPVPFPQGQVLSFGKAVHDRLTLEIARGCTRGCRFCQAGILYRPVRERTPETLNKILMDGLKETGYEETSFLSLSTGDYSALDGLFATSFDHCAAEQVSISLPSLRVGSISDSIMQRISSIRRTGATIAPEAGSQRMRDVINKGITEPEILDHVLNLFNNGWQSVKLYFMIGLPTETFEDLDAILDLCLKVRDVAGKHIKRLQITAAVSPFVPKTHTPFQWDRQISLEEINERLDYLKSIFRPHKRLQLKFHQPQMSFLEGVFSRGDRRLGNVLESAYKKGAIFSSWKDHLSLKPYMEAMEEFGLTPEEYQRERDIDEMLPWDHLSCGVSRKFLLTERRRSLEEKITGDCRYDVCRNCGICEFKGRKSLLKEQAKDKDIRPRMIFESRDQANDDIPQFEPAEKPDLGLKGSHFRLWFEKMGPTAYLSQLELQSVMERAMRRAELPLSFSQGYHPMPRISFGRALPVGVESRAEWLNIMLRTEVDSDELVQRLDAQMPIGLKIYSAEPLTLSRKHPQPQIEEYELTYREAGEKTRKWLDNWHDFMGSDSFSVERKTKKGTKTVDIRPAVCQVNFEGERGIRILFDWNQLYFNPIKFIDAVCPGSSLLDFRLVKTRQSFE